MTVSICKVCKRLARPSRRLSDNNLHTLDRPHAIPCLLRVTRSVCYWGGLTERSSHNCGVNDFESVKWMALMPSARAASMFAMLSSTKTSSLSGRPTVRAACRKDSDAGFRWPLRPPPRPPHTMTPDAQLSGSSQQQSK
eukprot:scaffold2089_cov336-Prasinococcus_capsulatus_cf.AAC.7